MASVLCCLPRVRPALLAASEFAQDLVSIPRGRPAVFNFINHLETFSVHPACCIHSGMDAKTSAWFAFPGLFIVLRYSLYQRVPPLDLLAIALPPTRV